MLSPWLVSVSIVELREHQKLLEIGLNNGEHLRYGPCVVFA